MSVRMTVILSSADGPWTAPHIPVGGKGSGFRLRLRIGGLEGSRLAALKHGLDVGGAAYREMAVCGKPVLMIEGEAGAIRAMMSGVGDEDIAGTLERSLEQYFRRELPAVRAGGRTIRFDRTRIMGILNVTPDSFSDGGMYFDEDSAVRRAVEMEREGADILDIGGESTRPGSVRVSAEEEMRRILPVISRVSSLTHIPISVDTMKPEVAAGALDAGASVINDVGGLSLAGMRRLVSRRGCPVVIMHMRGSPETMQDRPAYDDVVFEVAQFLKDRVEACEKEGISGENIIVDPGIGFGKTGVHNIRMLSELDAFRTLGRPILIGLSRKSLVVKLAGEDESRRLVGSLAAGLYGVMKGASLLRVHDVEETRKALNVWERLSGRADWEA